MFLQHTCAVPPHSADCACVAVRAASFDGGFEQG